MPLLYRTTDAAFAQAAVDALIKRGIDAYATGSTDPARGSYAQAQPEYCVFLTKAADSERATRILVRLGAAPTVPAAPSRAAPPRWLVWTVVLVVVALALFVALQSAGAP